MGEENLTESVKLEEVDISDLEARIIRQIEYYFGNFNLSKDKFLREQISLDEGWVPLETMVKFNRLKSICDDFTIIAGALKKSPTKLMEVSEDSTKIRRQVEKPLPENTEEFRAERDEKSLYVKGFKKTTTLDELLDFFKAHRCESVYMRKRPSASGKVFKGSVFVTFETKDDAVKFLENKSIKYGGVELLKEMKKAYFERKDLFYKNLKEEKAKKLLGKAEGERKDDDEKDSVEVPEIKIKEGCCLKITGLLKETSREEIKEAVESFGLIAYIDYNMGKPQAVVRFEEGIAAEAFKNIPEEDGERKLQIGPSKTTFSLIEGDEEKEYWKTIALHRANSRKRFLEKHPHKGNFGNRGNFGNKGRFKKNWSKRQKEKGNKNDDSEEPPKKRIKAENGAEVDIKVKAEETVEA